MLKAVKECMKNWLMVHERLYWYIVIGLAVLAFGVVTAVGCAKVYDANAAETSDGVYYPDLLNDVYMDDRYKPLIDSACVDYPYFVVSCIKDSSSKPTYYYLFSDAPFELYCKEQNGVYGAFVSADFEVTVIVGATVDWGVIGVQNDFGMVFPLSSFVGSNCEFKVKEGYESSTSEIALLPQKNLLHPNGPLMEYSSDAPYVTFERLDVVNKIADGNTKVMFVNPYEDYTKTSSWEYFGTLRNMDSSKDLEYLLEVEFLAELPKDTYLEKLADELGVDVTWEYNMLRNTPDLVMMWNADNRAEKDVYEFTYTFPVVPDEHGYFSYELAFDTIETLIQYFNTDARERIQSYEEGHRAFLLSFLHIDCVSAVVKTTREDSIVYGKITTNQFDRGIYDVCIEVIPDVDINTATPEEIDKIIADATQDAHDKYLKDLEERLENLQNQINGVGSVEGAFANGLDGTDLWSGFQSLSSGLVSLAPSIASLSVLMGAVFGFLPVQIVGAMSFTLFALCVIALIKAIRG